MFFRKSFKNQTSSMSINDDRMLDWLGIDRSNTYVGGTNSLKQATVFGCIKVLADSVSKLPVKIYQKQDNVKRVTDHYLEYLLKLRPNPYMSASDFWKCVETQRNIFGNSYVALDFNAKGQVKGLYPLDSSKMEIYIDDVGLLSSDNSIWYVYTDNLGNRIKFLSDEILHFKGLTTNGIFGVSVIDELRHLVENGKSTEVYLNNFFKNGLQTKGLIQYVGDLNSDAEKLFIEKFEQMSSGLDNAHRVALLPLGYKFEPMSQKLVDAQFIETSQLTIRQIAASFGVKMHQLNDLDRSTYSNITEQNREFYIDTLHPILNMYELEMNYKLFVMNEFKEGLYSKFNVDTLLRGDIKTRYESYAQAIQNGFKTPNEIRAIEDDEPLAGGDQLLVNGNMIPVSQAGAQYNKTTNSVKVVN